MIVVYQGTDPLHPILTRGFLEYAQYRGFIVDPARTRHPKDKPKVERNVPYARERFFKSGHATGPDDYPAVLAPYTTRAPDRIEREATNLGASGGRIRPAPLHWHTSLVQDPAGAQAAALGRTLHRQAPGLRLSEGFGRGPHRCAATGTHPGAGSGRGSHATAASTDRTFRWAR